MNPDTLADLLKTRLACVAADRELAKLEPGDPARPAAEATLKHAQERYAQAVRTQEEEANAARRSQ